MKYTISILDTVYVNSQTEEQGFIINPNTGCWFYVDNSNLNEINFLLKKKELFIEDFLQEHPSKFPLIKDLFQYGLISLNGKYLYKRNTSSVNEGVDAQQLVVIINVTTGCNLVCSYCYAHTQNKVVSLKKEDLLSYIELLRTTIDDRFMTIVFHGGEPLTVFPFVRIMIAEIRNLSKNINLSIQTNGTLLTEQIAIFLKENNVSIGVSIDGTTELSNSNRLFKSNKTSVFHVINSIKTLVYNNCNFGVLSVITPKGIPDLYVTFKDLLKLGVTKFAFNTLLYTGRAAENDKNKVIEIDIEALTDAYVKIACLINDLNNNRKEENYVSERSISTFIKSLSLYDHSLCYCTPCGAGHQTIAIDIKGDIYSCDCLVGNKEFYMGRIYDKILPSIKACTLLSERKIEHIIKCSTCDIRKLCIYKCGSDSFYRHGDLKHPHSLCEFSKQIIPQFMRLIATKRINPKLFIIC